MKASEAFPAQRVFVHWVYMQTPAFVEGQPHLDTSQLPTEDAMRRLCGAEGRIVMTLSGELCLVAFQTVSPEFGMQWRFWFAHAADIEAYERSFLGTLFDDQTRLQQAMLRGHQFARPDGDV